MGVNSVDHLVIGPTVHSDSSHSGSRLLFVDHN